MRRKGEFILGIVTAVVIGISLGNFPMIAFKLSSKTYNDVYKPMYAADLKGMTEKQGITLLQNLGMWITVILVIMLIFAALASFFAFGNRGPKRAAVFYVLAGLITLIGIQNPTFPFAYLFFIDAAIMIFRKVDGTNFEKKPKKRKLGGNTTSSNSLY